MEKCFGRGKIEVLDRVARWQLGDTRGPRISGDVEGDWRGENCGEEGRQCRDGQKQRKREKKYKRKRKPKR